MELEHDLNYTITNSERIPIGQNYKGLVNHGSLTTHHVRQDQVKDLCGRALFSGGDAIIGWEY